MQRIMLRHREYCYGCPARWTLEFLVNNCVINDIFTLRAKLSGAVYCYRSCLSVCISGRAAGLAGGVCYHDNWKMRASIFTKLRL